MKSKPYTFYTTYTNKMCTLSMKNGYEGDGAWELYNPAHQSKVVIFYL